MVTLFGRDQSVIARHIRNIFVESELEQESVHVKLAYTAEVVSFRLVWLAQLLDVVVALLWLISDRCIERRLHVDQFET